MKIQYKFTAIAGVLAFMCSCSDADVRQSNQESTLSPITLSAAYPAASRASDAGFEDGDMMGVFVLDYHNDTPEQITDDDIHGSNVKYTFNAPDNSWRGATTLYWTSISTPADIIGYYPFVSDIEDTSTVPFTISRRQDISGSSDQMGGYEASDMLWGKIKKAMPTADRIDLKLNHLMAAVRITLIEGTGFSAEEWGKLEKTVQVANIIPNAKVNLSDGSVKVESNNPISITPYSINGDWRAIVIPQSVSAGETLLQISVDGISYNFSKNSQMVYTQGKLHNFAITVNRNGTAGNYEFVLSDESITPWIDDAEFRDGIMREYVIVNVDSRGTLQECVNAMKLQEDDIINLKITGECDERDFEYIREKLDYLKSLNLLDCEVYENNVKSVIPANALYGKNKLNHIVFPRHLTVIGSCAFFGCGLMGDLIIPEGVTHIGTNSDLTDAIPGHWGGGWGAFTDCSSLVGNLTLPSTLVFIESAAFCRTQLTGELRIPESVRFIGSMAFDSSKFNGSLNLPENLTEIGVGAFFRVPFTGNLSIPQGIKTIRTQTFSGGNYSLLSLPEGLIEINDQAFIDCGFRGELKLPSTLRRIGNSAFEGNKFSNIVFPNHLNYMGNSCFANNSRLSGTLTIPDGITAINEGSFANCTLLDEIVIGDNITKIEGYAFAECYNLSSVVVNNPEPPLLTIRQWDSSIQDAFYGVPKDNFTLQVPEKSIEAYRTSEGWKEFKRIAAYSNFVCRPSFVCALTSRHQESIILNSDGEWEIMHKPDWCSVSRNSGNGKTEILLTINEMPKGAGNRTDSIEFSLKGTEFTTKCALRQYDYIYGEDECITLQKATKGNGIDVLFVGEGWDGAAISEGKYLDLVKEQTEAFFGIEPYSTFRDYFNVYACVSLSQETGVSTANLWRNTRFSTIFAYDCSGTTGNLILDDANEVFDYATQNSPLKSDRMWQSLIIMSLNSDEYGSATTLTWNGSAISICCASSDPYPMDTRGIIQHEACGHGFGKLADERIIKNRYLNSKEKYDIEDLQERGWYQNVSTSGKMADVPWSQLIFHPDYSVDVDVYEGAYGVTRGAYRSELNSCMNYGIPYFNAISRHDIMKRILEYAGDEFSTEKFYTYDTNKWGATSNSRSAMPDRANDYVSSALHHPITIIKSKKY